MARKKEKIALAEDKTNLPAAKFRYDKERNKYVCEYQPLPHQKVLHDTKASQILVGGAAGPGKSLALRFDGYQFSLQNPGLKAYLFRKTRGELQKNHIDNVKVEVPESLAVFNRTTSCLEFKNGSILYFCYCASDDDLLVYQGSEIHLLLVDEATHLTEYQLNYLRSRVRLGSFIPEEDADRLPRTVFASNPGNVGHNFLKRTFVDQSPAPNKVFIDRTTALPEKEINGNIIRPAYEGHKSIYIPANFHANPYIDPSYEAQFAGLPPEQIRALVEGDWDAQVGAALHNLSKERHMVPDFIQSIDCSHMTKIMAYDHGTASPGACIWALIPDQALEITWKAKNKTIYVPEDSVVIFKEWYLAQPNTDNTGLKLPAGAVARGILNREKEWKIEPDYRVADYAIWSSDSGPSVQQDFAKHGVQFRQATKNRVQMYAEILSRLAGNPQFTSDGRTEIPALFVCESCENWWRLCPPLVVDDKQPDKGISKTKQQADHLADATMYLLMSRPYAISREERLQQDFDSYREQYLQAREDLGATVVDPYFAG